MSEADEQEQDFKVRDRRRFDAEGKARDDEPEGGAAEAPDPDPGPQAPRDESIPRIDFSTFLFSLSTSAMVHLGEAPAPDGSSEKNLQLARQTIDMLALLQEKTQGNLTEEEDQLLAQLLYDLRVRYVQAAS